MKSLLRQIATLFGVGRFPKAPGTVGTLATIPIFVALSQISIIAYMTVVLIIAIVGIIAAQAYQEETGEHDRAEIVIDEVAGFLITMTMVPVHWKTIIIGFLIFRFLDILKPWPIGMLDKNVKGGAGVMADDIVAGIIGNVIMQVLLHYYGSYI